MAISCLDQILLVSNILLRPVQKSRGAISGPWQYPTDGNVLPKANPEYWELLIGKLKDTLKRLIVVLAAWLKPYLDTDIQSEQIL